MTSEKENHSEGQFFPCFLNPTHLLPNYVSEKPKFYTPSRPPPPKSRSEKWKAALRPKRLLHKFVPISNWLPNYKWREWAVPDTVSGLTIAIMQVPQGKKRKVKNTYLYMYLNLVVYL